MPIAHPLSPCDIILNVLVSAHASLFRLTHHSVTGEAKRVHTVPGAGKCYGVSRINNDECEYYLFIYLLSLCLNNLYQFMVDNYFYIIYSTMLFLKKLEPIFIYINFINNYAYFKKHSAYY